MNPNVRGISHQQKISNFQQLDYVPNNFPNSTRSHKKRENLNIVEVGQGKARGEMLNKGKCMICNEQKENEQLYTCDGRINGEMKKGRVMELAKRPCNSQFHLECIKAYNASNFDFHYAARVECQRKFLCPLHCCSVCNSEHKKQSAYESKLIECAKCFRAFHVDCCYPAGSEKLDVTIGSATFKMLICPSHSDPAPVSQHIPACCSPDCEVDGELRECKKCIRSFHRECREVKKITEELNEKDAPEDLCDSCLREDVILVGSPVIALNPTTNTFRMGKAGAAERQGWMSIEWLKNGRSDGNSLVPCSHVAEVRESYFNLAKGNQKSHWKTTFDDHKNIHLQRYPLVLKKVSKLVKASRFAEGNQKNMGPSRAENVCECGMTAHCDMNNCANATNGCECPPSCSKNKAEGYVCNNRRISTGFVNPKIEMKESGKKGFGIVAKEIIEKGEFLAAFHGEICDGEEYERRRAVKVDSRDQQASDQFMELSDGFTLDMDREGSIARYVNHSCHNFNAVFPKKRVRVVGKRNNKGYPYEPRRYLVASRTIKAKEEVTISYGFFNKYNGCLCETCKKDTKGPELHDDADKENAKPSGATKRKATSKTNSRSAKAFKPSQ